MNALSELLPDETRKWAKDVLWRAASLGGARGLGRRALRGTAVVAGLHRVSQGPERSGLDCSAARFEALCRFFRKHFTVAPLSEIAARMVSGDLDGPYLAITFDDGYRDNLTEAAPILLRLGLPATFFLTSGFIGSNDSPWWDKARGSVHPFLTWDEVAILRDMGFSLGAHTRTHADLSQLDAEALRGEIAGSRADVAAALGEAPSSFAYPYGQRDQISLAGREEIRRAGFDCCCGLYGGINRGGDDPFHLRRMPVSGWYVTPAHFGGDAVVSAVKDARSRRAGTFQP